MHFFVYSFLSFPLFVLMIIGKSLYAFSLFLAIADPVAGHEAAEPSLFLQLMEKPFLEGNPNGA